MEQIKNPWIRGVIHTILVVWVIYSIFPFVMSILTSTMVVRDVIARDPKFMPQFLVENNIAIAILLAIVIIGVYLFATRIRARRPRKFGETKTDLPLDVGSLVSVTLVLLSFCGIFLWLTSIVGEDQIFQPTAQAYQNVWLRNDAAIAAFGPIGTGLIILIIALISIGIYASNNPDNPITNYAALGMIVGGTLFALRQVMAWVGDIRIDETFLAANAERAVFVPEWFGFLVAIGIGTLVFGLIYQNKNGATSVYFAIVFVIVSVIIGLPQFVRYDVFYESFLNTVIVTVSTVTISISIGCLAAYALARYRGLTGFMILMTALGFRALPRLAFILPYYYFANITGLFDTHILLIITFVTINQPFTIWMLRSFFMDIPREIEESAMIDGCNRLTAFTRVIIPIVWPGIITTALFSMLLAYNEFLLASLLTSTVQTLPVAMAQYTSGETLRVLPAMNASAVSITIPIVIIIIFFQRYLIKGLAGGAVKG